MSLKKAQEMAEEAASTARLDSDLSEAVAQLAESVAELARSMRMELQALDKKLDDLNRTAGQIRSSVR